MKFSVIVPVYGVERYLNQCIESVLAQEYRDFEMILVDDRSPDGCPEICDDWAKKDSRIRVVHKPVNEGLRFARNSGLAVAKGTYVLFLDADDYVDPRYLMTCNRTMKPDTDILVFGFEMVYENGHGKRVYTEKKAPRSGCACNPEEKGDLFVQLSDLGTFPFAWNKVYRRDFLSNGTTGFEQTKLIEDFLFNISLFEKADRIVTISDILYYYRRPAHETLGTQYAPDFFELSKRKYALEKGFLEECGALSEAAKCLICGSYLKHIVAAVIKNHVAAERLSWGQQIERIEAMVNDATTVAVVEDFIPKRVEFRLLKKLVRDRNCVVLMGYCMGINLMQQKMLPIYRHLLKR